MWNVTAIPRTRVYAGGTPVGIYMKTRGILVVGTGAVEKTDGSFSDPAENILHSGDYIVAANGSAVTRKEELVSEVGASAGEPVVLKVEQGRKSHGASGSASSLDKRGCYKLGSPGPGRTPRASEH